MSMMQREVKTMEKVVSMVTTINLLQSQLFVLEVANSLKVIAFDLYSIQDSGQMQSM
jgi:hypothetical protein